MKRFLFILICLNGFLFQTQMQSQTNVVDEVIWVIGDDAILLSDVERLRLDMQMQGERLMGDPYCFIPELLAINKLFLHQAKLDSIEISDSQVYSQVDAHIKYVISHFGSQEKLEEYFNKSINAYREETRNALKEQEAIRQVKYDLVSKVKVTPSEVRTFYKKIPVDSLPYISTTVEVEIITLEPQPALEEIDNIKSRLREYTEQVTNGSMQFSSLARTYSQDKESALQGGEIGLRGKAELVPEFAAAAFDLNDPRRVSRIVETEYGFHIIQLIEKRGDRINVRHILLRPYVSKNEIDVALQKLDSLRNDIVASKFTFEDATYFFSADKDTKNNRGLMVNTPTVYMPNMTERSGTARFEMQELPPEIAKAVNTLQVGEMSDPFVMLNAKTGKEMVAIVKLKARIEGHKASLTEDIQTLKAMAENEKREEVINKWIAKKQRETYIRINDNWKNCDFERDGWIQK